MGGNIPSFPWHCSTLPVSFTLAFIALVVAEGSGGKDARSSGFWAKKLDASSGLQERSSVALSPAVDVGADTFTTPEAELTAMLTKGPTNRRPAEELAASQHAALKQALQDVREPNGVSSGMQRKRPWHQGTGAVEAAREVYAVAPRTWDTHLIQFNEKHARDAEQRSTTGFAMKLDALISHLNTTIVNAPKKRGGGGGIYGRAAQPHQEGEMTKSVKRERQRLVEQLLAQRKELLRLSPPAAKQLVASMKSMLSDPSVLSSLGLADADAEERLRAKQRWEAAHRRRIDPLDPFAPTRKWLDIQEARAMMPDNGDERRPIGRVVPNRPSVHTGGEEAEEESSLPWSSEGANSPWYCSYCKISVTNDLAWVDHIHGKAHNKQLGFSMRVKPDTEDEILDEFERQLARLRKLRRRRERLRRERGEQYCSSDSDVWRLSEDDPNDPYLFPHLWDWDL